MTHAAIEHLVSACRAMALLAFLAGSPARGEEAALRVAVIGNTPPMSYEDAEGRLVGFNVEMAEALCATMKVRCELRKVAIGDVVDAVSGGQVDFAAVSFLITPERQKKVLFSKPYYRSVSVWLAKPAVRPGMPGITVSAVRNTAQAKHIEAHGWKSLLVEQHRELSVLLGAGTVDAVIVPMSTALLLTQDKALQGAGIKPVVLQEADLGGDVGFCVNPRRPELRARLDMAIDEVKNDGRFDRINTKYIPFRLQ